MSVPRQCVHAERCTVNGHCRRPIDPFGIGDRRRFFLVLQRRIHCRYPGDLAGAPITIQPAPAVSDPILDGGHTQDVLTVGTDVYLNLSDLTIQDGGGSSNNGAGLTNTSGGTVARHPHDLLDNIATNDGGAIDNGDYGGGTATLTITGSTFADNISSFNGGAIDNADDDGTGVVTVSNSTFTGNTGYDGGAIDNGDRREAQSTPSTVTVTDSTFSGNTSNNDGGAIDSSDDGSGTTTISESTFSGNIAQSNGGAIDNGDLNDNYFPGGLGTLDVATSTFSGNFASSHGLTIDSGDDGGSAAATVAANVFAGSCSQAGGTWTDQGYNVGSDASCFNGGTGDNSSAGSNLANLLGPLADNGGSTETTLLLTGNPAIGIIPDPTAGLCPVAADQRGFPSPANQPCNAGSLQPGVGATYTCAVSGVLGPTSVPVVVGASPAPPSSIDAGGTFEITPAARVTIPASVINQFIGAGATSLTVASQTTTLDGRSSVGGPLSGAVQPNTESASASNLPLSDTLVANTPYTFNTTYDPVTFQTGPATGTVAVTPGDVDAEVTFVIRGDPNFRIDDLYATIRGGGPGHNDGQCTSGHPCLPGTHCHPASPEPNQCGHRRRVGGDHRQHLDGAGDRAVGHGERDRRRDSADLRSGRYGSFRDHLQHGRSGQADLLDRCAGRRSD